MATPGSPADSLKSSRGKDQIHWPDGVWQALDHATTHELHKARVASQFLHAVHVHKKETTVPSDVVIIPTPPAAGAAPDALSIDEAGVKRIDELSVLTRMSVAQIEAEAHHEENSMVHTGEAGHASGSMPMAHPTPSAPLGGDHHDAGGASSHHVAPPSHRATSGVSLAIRAANLLAQAEDLMILNGSNGVANSPLFVNKTVQVLDPNIVTNLGTGLLNIDTTGQINKPVDPSQVILVHPTNLPAGGGALVDPPTYRENTLNAVAQGVAVLQGLGHYEHYALVLQTYPYADLHSALPTTLVTPVEPIRHLVKAGVFGTGALPPFDGAKAGLPGKGPDGKVLKGVAYTGVLACISPKNMDLVRGRMENNLDAVVSFSQKDVGEQYRFRTSQRFAFRLKDFTSFVLLVFVTV